jgi:pyochelin biosynthesis protein PchC
MSVPPSDATRLTDAWIRCFHPGGDASVRLACFPHAGGSASFYFPLSARLAPGVEALVVQYPGRQDRRLEPPLGSIDELARQAAGALAPWLDRPLALFGHSMGALVAFEVARLLEHDGGRPCVLIVSGRRAPSRTRPETVHQRDDAGVLRELRRLSGTDERLFGNEDLLRLILPTVRADYRALAAYRPAGSPSLDCPIVGLVGDADPVAPTEDVRAWAENTTAGFELHVLPGGHFYLADRQAEVTSLIARAVEKYGA